MVAVMRAAQALGARDAVVLDHGDSGDVSGDKSSVVGYMAAALGIITEDTEGTVTKDTKGSFTKDTKGSTR